MRTVWTQAALLLLGSLIAAAAGAWMVRTALAQTRIPQELLGTRKALKEIGGEQGLLARKQALIDVQESLELERSAKSSSAAAFSRRLEEVFAELGLSIRSSSDWQAVPEFKVAGAAAFERTFSGSGAFEALLDAVNTLESWPDQVRVRALSASATAPGTVAFTLEITAVRLASREESEVASAEGRLTFPAPPGRPGSGRRGPRALPGGSSAA